MSDLGPGMFCLDQKEEAILRAHFKKCGLNEQELESCIELLRETRKHLPNKPA